MSSSFSIRDDDDDGARARYELDRARADITRLSISLWDEYFKAAIIATACSADDVERAAEIADAALAERVKRGGCAGVDWLSDRLGNVEHDRRTEDLSPGVRVDGPVGPHTEE